MKIKNLRIGTQLIISFAIILLLVILLGVVSLLQNNKLAQQTVDIFKHPLQVRKAVGKLNSDILAIHCDMKDVLLASDEKEITDVVNNMEVLKENAFDQIDILYRQYLGPLTDIDTLKNAFIIWNSIRQETIRLLKAEKTQDAINRTKSTGIGGKQVEIVFTALQKIDDFAKAKSENLYSTSLALKKMMNNQLILLVVIILLLSLLINFVLLRNVRKPLDELTNATQRFHDGEMDARSSYISKNEFGLLSASFNTLAESIQGKADLDEKFADLAALMLSEYEVKKFFQATINNLAAHTGSQIAAIYLLSDNKKTFNHFESIGLDSNARQSFAADSFEGEFGAALFSRKIQHIRNIKEDTRFIFHTVSGKIIPREVITIPIIADNEAVAVISLASVHNYSKQSIQLIDKILVTLCARIEGILAYHKVKEILKKIEYQNEELEAQKTELAYQSAELKEQNTELEMQKNLLSEANKLKTNFLSNMSHELRTPLNSVIALSGVLCRRLNHKISEEEYSFIEVIARNGKQLLNLINDILDISRIEAGHEEVEVTKFNANNLIAEIVAMIKPQAGQKNIELLHKESEPTLTIFSDTEKYNHILQNLISNAVKFTNKGKVEILARISDNNITVTVTDTGIGISEDHLPHIFDEFRQADSSTSRKFGGTGLGLAIAGKYANMLGGTITVKSTLEKGSEFTLTLPLKYDAGNRITDTEPSISLKPATGKIRHKHSFDASSKTILLVEDSEPAIIQIKDFLEESGYNILIAHDGGEALNIIAQTMPDAMILDLMMPGIDGFEVLKTLREVESTAHIPVLILTAKHITKEELTVLKRNNIHQLIQKGDVNRNELLSAVSTMVFPKITEKEKPRRESIPIERKPVVLVVEDNADNMITVKAILDTDYTVIEAVDGNEGVEMAKKHKPDLILMDIALPDTDGIEAFKIIRNDINLQYIPVIALTASAMKSDRETILMYGFDAYIAKPIDNIYFCKVIKEMLYGK